MYGEGNKHAKWGKEREKRHMLITEEAISETVLKKSIINSKGS